MTEYRAILQKDLFAFLTKIRFSLKLWSFVTRCGTFHNHLD